MPCLVLLACLYILAPPESASVPPQADWDSLALRDDGVQEETAWHGGNRGLQTAASDEVTAHSITCTQDIDIDKFNVWISELLKTRGDRIFRTKASIARSHTHAANCCSYPDATALTSAHDAHRVFWLPEGSQRSLCGNRST